MILFSKDVNDRAIDDSRVVQIWLERYRTYILRPATRVGGGLASRRADDGLEATWVVFLATDH